MSAVLDYLNVCRLCLVKDKVNIAIFDETGDVRQLFLKISACLPVKVAQDDRLPKKICDSCLYKVDLLYQFWNTTISSEKQLLQWCGGYTGGENETITGAGVTLLLPQSHAHPHSIHTETILVKEEQPDSADTKSGDGYGPELSTATATVSASDLYSEEFALTYHQQQPEQLTTVNYTNSAPNQTPTKRPRGRPPGSTKKKRHATRSRARRDSVEDSDDDRPLAATISVQEDHLNSAAGLQITKKEAESDEDYVDNTESLEPTTFVAVPSTSACELPGPSGTVTKDSSASIEQGPANLIWTAIKTEEQDLLTSKKKRTDKIKYTCTVCSLGFTSRKKLVKHVRIHKPQATRVGTKYQCDLCTKLYTSQITLRKHKLRCTQDYTHRCTACDKGFYCQSAYEKHYKVEHSGVRYQCTHCGKVFKDYYAHIKHERMHAPDYTRRAYKCSECDKVYQSAGGLRWHVREAHEHADLACICDVCGKSVSSPVVLRDHKNTHTGARPYTCSTCGKGFKSAAQLQVHVRTHTGERPHACTTCSKRFTQRSTLVIHMRSHTGERPYACTICGKEFVSHNLMKIHSKVHGTALADI